MMKNLFCWRNNWLIFILLLSTTPSWTQSLHAIWILNEGNSASGESVSLGRFDPTFNSYETVMTFPDANFASDVIASDDGIYIAAENGVYRLDPDTHELLAEADVPSARKLALFNGSLYVTRGDIAPLDSYLWALDALDLEVEEVFQAVTGVGPEVPAEGMVAVGQELIIAVNNGFSWGEEVGRIGRLTEQGEYSEWNLPEGAENPVHLFAHGDDICVISNGSWDQTTLTRMDLVNDMVLTISLPEVTAGCNAAALVGEDRIAFQISGETHLRQADVNTLEEEENLMLNGATYYAMATDPTTGVIYASHTDWVSYGQVEMFAADGMFLGSFDCGVSPGNLAMEIRETTSDICPDDMKASQEWVPVAAWDLSGKCLETQVSGVRPWTLRVEQSASGEVRKLMCP